MKFSILIPTLNNVEYLKICINSILKNSFFEHEIIVHSNNSSDTTSSFLKSQNIQELRTETNYGLCTALNQLASKAKYDYLLFIRPDCKIVDKFNYRNFLFAKNNRVLSPKFGKSTGLNNRMFIGNYNQGIIFGKSLVT